MNNEIRRNMYALNKMNVLTAEELEKCGVKPSISYGKYGFVDTTDSKQIKIFTHLIKTGKYEPMTWQCEGDTDYFSKGYWWVNRLAYGHTKKRKAGIKI